MNDNLVLISGETGTGKSASLRNIKNPEGVMYLNCEAGKKLPFPESRKYKSATITDPMELMAYIAKAETRSEIHTIVIDSLSFLMDMFESKYIVGAVDGMAGWSQYAQYLKNLMQQHVAKSSKNIIFTAHTFATYNEAAMAMEVKVPIKGASSKNGVEAYFSNVISTKKVSIKDLEAYQSDSLNISEEERMVGYKHCFQTRITKDTVNERIRAPLGMWTITETYIDNDLQLVLERLKTYYEE